VRLSAGQSFEFGGMQIRVLAPLASWAPAAEPRNNDSLVTHFQYGETAFLMGRGRRESGGAGSSCAVPYSRRPAQGRSQRQPDQHDTGAIGRSPPTMGSDFRRRAQHIRPPSEGDSKASPGCGSAYIPHGPAGSSNVLPGWARGQRAVGVSPLMSTSAVSSSPPVDVRDSSIRRRASSASSWRTRITMPPKPGNMS
jgi:hypothetical protein